MNIDRSAQATRQKKSSTGGKFGSIPKSESVTALSGTNTATFAAVGAVQRLPEYTATEVKLTDGISFETSEKSTASYVQRGEGGSVIITQGFVTSEESYEITNIYFDPAEGIQQFPNIQPLDDDQSAAADIEDAHTDFVRSVQRGTYRS